MQSSLDNEVRKRTLNGMTKPARFSYAVLAGMLIAALGNNTVEVVDTAGGARLRSLAGFREPQASPSCRICASQRWPTGKATARR